MRLDAHQHFWALERDDYGWLTSDLPTIYRDFQPADLTPILDRHAIEGTILVQAAPTRAETDYMLDIAAQHSFVKGVVGWVDFENSHAPEHIARLAENPYLVGLRPMIQDIADTNWMLRPDLNPAFVAMIASDLVFDALTLPAHLQNLSELLSRYPTMRVVIDHGSKPDIRAGTMDSWAKDMGRLATNTSCFCKLSGLVTEAAPNWTPEDLKPYVDHLLATFGPSRLIWGSDWPVCTLAATYDQWLETTHQLLEGLPASDIDAILGGNAMTAYGLERT